MTAPLSQSQQDGLRQITGLMETHALSPADVKRHYSEHTKEKKQIESGRKELNKSKLILRLFAYLGGTLIFAGLGVFIETVWDDIGSLPRVIITFGSGFTAYLCGLVFALDKRFEKIAIPAFIVAFIMQPFGLFVLLKEYFPGDNAPLGLMVVFGPLALQQGLTFTKFRYKSLLLFALLFFIGFVGGLVEYMDFDRGLAALLFGTFLLFVTIDMQMRNRVKEITPIFFVISTLLFFSGVYYYVGRTAFDPISLSLILSLLGFAVIKESKTLYVMCMIYMSLYFAGGPGGGWFDDFDSHTSKQIAAIFTGTSLMLAGQWLRRTNFISLYPLWMFLGTGFALAGLYALFPAPFEPIAIGFAAAAIYGALLLKSRAVLAAAVLSLIGFIVEYSATHFAHTVGWPILLMVIGVLTLASGFLFAKLS